MSLCCVLASYFMATMTAKSVAAVSTTANNKNSNSSHHDVLHRLLQQCLPVVQQNAFHPVLLQSTLQALQSYIVWHQAAAATATATAAVNNSKNKTNPQQSQHEAENAQLQQPQPPTPSYTKPNNNGNIEASTNPSHPSLPQQMNSKPISLGEVSPTAATPATATTKATTPTPNNKNNAIDDLSNLPPEVRLEQQKKLAAERRRKDLELQRKLARAETKYKELQTKRTALATDQRKQQLVVVQSEIKDPTKSLSHIQQQMAVVDKEISRIQQEMKQIRAEMQQRKREAQLLQKAMTTSTKQHKQAANRPTTVTEPANAQERLEEQKRAAAEKRRRELEEQRQRARLEVKRQEEEKRRAFLEQERRKQELIEQAKTQRSGLDDLDIMKKLNLHVNQFEQDEVQLEENHEEDGERIFIDSEIKQSDSSSSVPMQHQEDTYHPITSPMSSENQSENTQQHFFSFPSPGAAAHGSHTPAAAASYETASPEQPSAPPSQQPHQHHPQSGSDQKYMKMAAARQEGNADEEDDDPSLHTELKRNILLQWALQPPHMQFLRPIHELLSTVQTVYPPANGVEAHEYFDAWQVMDLHQGHDEKKLNKAVRKLRFFLHPDKRPHNFDDKHHFVCKLLWDVTNDAWEDYKRAKEELDWIH